MRDPQVPDDYERWLDQHDSHCRTLRRIERWTYRVLALLALGVLAVLLHACVVTDAVPLWLAMPGMIAGTLLVVVAWQVGTRA